MSTGGAVDAGTPLSLRLARLLLVAAAALTVGTAAYIAVQTSSILVALPWLVLLVLNAAGFVAAAVWLEDQPRRATLLAVGSAIAMGALGTITGWGAGMLSFPAAGFGALGAWAALLHPPRRRMVVAFLAYMAVGLAVSIPTLGAALLYPWTLALVAIWPLRLILLPSTSFFGIYLGLALGASVLLLVAVRRRPFTASLTLGMWMILGAISVLVGVGAVALFNVYAIARPHTSARFELDGLVLALVFAGGLLVALGLLTLRLWPTAFSAFALGFGAVALFLVFTYRPAATCEPNGFSGGTPLAWELRGSGAGGMSSSGSSAASPGGSTFSNGEIRSGDRVATYRCENDRLVEYREVR